MGISGRNISAGGGEHVLGSGSGEMFKDNCNVSKAFKKTDTCTVPTDIFSRNKERRFAYLKSVHEVENQLKANAVNDKPNPIGPAPKKQRTGTVTNAHVGHEVLDEYEVSPAERHEEAVSRMRIMIVVPCLHLLVV